MSKINQSLYDKVPTPSARELERDAQKQNFLLAARQQNSGNLGQPSTYQGWACEILAAPRPPETGHPLRLFGLSLEYKAKLQVD
ncbi:hypothetical protein VTL71DRAFT_8972, partial [Oculimacula yallundae]